MESSKADRSESIFAAALGKPAGPDRIQFVHEASAGEVALAKQVLELLEAHEKARVFLESPAANVQVPSSDSSKRGNTAEETIDHVSTEHAQGELIAGKYKLAHTIGEGGMGTVWMAEQTSPVKRKVAIKLIKAGMDSKAVLARFEAERQALAIMDHPNIAKVLDADLDAAGRPFFVMELVKGIPITKYCDEYRLTPKQRLELFVPVCQAVQHAHQKGVIHRDIKPTNVLVARYDDRPVPKVIDFGIAKATGRQLTEKTLVTEFDAVVGTPEYMSPEQASFNQLNVDTRTDVYSLGVLMYELLAGTPPFARSEIEKIGLLEMLRVVREVDPPKPSTRLTTSATLASLAATRNTEPKQLASMLRGELDWIVMRALEKDRTRRYETALGLARDVERYLIDEPVEACPPSTYYRARKFFRKHKTTTVTGLLVFLSLTVGIGVATCAMFQAKEGQRLAIQSRKEERKMRTKAEYLATSLEIDAVQELKDGKAKLLNLSRLYSRISEDQSALREHLMLVIVGQGQEFASLFPPIAAGDVISRHYFSHDHEYLFTFGKSGNAQIWSTRSGRHIATLQSPDNVPIASCGLTADKTRVYTLHNDGRVRIWKIENGILLSSTPMRPANADNGERSKNLFVAVAGDRILTQQFALTNTAQVATEGTTVVEIWDAASGDLIAKSDAREFTGKRLDLLPSGKWIVSTNPNELWEVRDEKLVLRLGSDSTTSLSAIHANDTGSVLATVFKSSDPGKKTLRLLDGNTLISIGEVTVADHRYIWFADDALILGDVDMDGPHPEQVVYFDTNNRLQSCSLQGGTPDLMRSNRQSLFDGQTSVFDFATRKMHLPMTGSKYCVELRDYALNNRYLLQHHENIDDQPRLLDLFVEKPVCKQLFSGSNILGLLAMQQDQNRLVLCPLAFKSIRPEHLALWSEVVVCGNLSATGEFQKWSEDTWEQNRQELAKVSGDFGFPFPGYVAKNPLYYVWREFESTDPNALDERTQLAKNLIQRAKAIGSQFELNRARRELAKLAVARIENDARSKADYSIARHTSSLDSETQVRVKQLLEDGRSTLAYFVASEAKKIVDELSPTPDRLAHAIKAAELAATLSKNDDQTIVTLGAVYNKASRFKDAKEVFRKLQKVDSALFESNIRAQSELGVTEFRLGNVDAAKSILQKLRNKLADSQDKDDIAAFKVAEALIEGKNSPPVKNTK